MHILDYVGKGVLNTNTFSTSTLNRSEFAISQTKDNNSSAAVSNGGISCHNANNNTTITADQSSQYNCTVYSRTEHPMVNIPLTPNTLKQLKNSASSLENTATVISAHSTTQEIEALRKKFNTRLQEAIVDLHIHPGTVCCVQKADNINRNSSTSINTDNDSRIQGNVDNNSIAAICANIKVEDNSVDSQEIANETTAAYNHSDTVKEKVNDSITTTAAIDTTLPRAVPLTTEASNIETLINAVESSSNFIPESKCTETSTKPVSLCSMPSTKIQVKNSTHPKRRRKRRQPKFSSKKRGKKTASTATKISVAPVKSRKNCSIREVKGLYNDLQRNIQLSNLVDSIVNPDQQCEGRRLRRATVDVRKSFIEQNPSPPPPSIENVICPPNPTPNNESCSTKVMENIFLLHFNEKNVIIWKI